MTIIILIETQKQLVKFQKKLTNRVTRAWVLIIIGAVKQNKKMYLLYTQRLYQQQKRSIKDD